MPEKYILSHALKKRLSWLILPFSSNLIIDMRDPQLFYSTRMFISEKNHIEDKILGCES